MRVNRRAVLSAAGLSAVAVALPASAANDSDAMKAAAQRYVDEVLNAGNIAVIDELVSPDIEASSPEDAPGRDAYKTRIENMIQFDGYSVDDLSYSVENMATRGADLLMRGYASGTSSQGKRVNALYFMQFRFADNVIVAHWLLRDEAGMLGL